MTQVITQHLKEIQPWLLPRKPEAHKGDFGHVLVIGGDYGMAGAVHLSAEAALRVGAGLVTVATRPENVVGVNAARAESLCFGVSKTDELDALLDKATVIVIGMGLGQSEWSLHCLKKALAWQKLMVIDADALNLLAQFDLPNLANAIITPHPGEASRLLGCSVKTIQADRAAAVKQLHARYQAISVLKGSGTLIKGQDEDIYHCAAGNPGMASGGMGDVLSGVIGGLLAQGLSLAQSARLGVQLHAEAADLAAKNDGMRGMLASDLFPYLRKLVNFEIDQVFCTP